jgi:micrococcal nuclease
VAILAVLAVLAVLSGCTVPLGGGSTTPDAGATAPSTRTPAPGAVAVAVTVPRVIDGDTVEVRYPNGTEDTVRLVGVDAPETRADNTPGEYPGVPDTEAGRSCLRTAGEAATDFVAGRLEGERVGLRFDPDLDRRGYYGRLLAYVVVEDTTLNYELVERGHARVYASPFADRERYERAMNGAMEAGRGLWECAASGPDPVGGSDGAPLSVARVNADAPGDDDDSLARETVTFANAGDVPLDLTGWTVSDDAGREYRFPNGFTLAPGERVTLHTGSGTDSAGDLFWGLDRAVWNNDGDTITVRNAGGEVVVRRSYRSRSAVGPAACERFSARPAQPDPWTSSSSGTAGSGSEPSRSSDRRATG